MAVPVPTSQGSRTVTLNVRVLSTVSVCYVFGVITTLYSPATVVASQAG